MSIVDLSDVFSREREARRLLIRALSQLESTGHGKSNLAHEIENYLTPASPNPCDGGCCHHGEIDW